ncbi:MAG: hypothetical protein IGR76_02745 [Synechococcales cyanobacterium T60_A2020_003]|nr:hypothetical protein [Synechococcales cyanobacterium T60_A2020_003]
MKLLTAMLMTVGGLTVVSMVSTVHAQQNGSFTGTVERVWEDGFRLNTGDRTLRIDSWYVCRDSTASAIAVGDRLTVTGEFEWGEFDAFSITTTNGESLCRR